MPAYFNAPDIVKIAVMGFTFVWLANMGLQKFGLSEFCTKPA